jgi:hypothetical protein
MGGMIFGGFSEEELQSLWENRSSFPSGSGIDRGGQFKPWKNGAMLGFGSRMPSGGRKGDTYTMYRGMAIRDDIEVVRKLFKYAKVRSLYIIIRIYPC